MAEEEPTMALKFRTRTQREYLTGREHEVRPLTLEQRTTEPERSTLEQTALVAGRLIFGGYFLYSGIHHFTDREMLIGYAKSKGVAWPRGAGRGSRAHRLSRNFVAAIDEFGCRHRRSRSPVPE